MEASTTILSNGIGLIYLPSASPVSYTGLLINTGSRDEKPHETGMAHMMEHMLFKGTLKRKPYHILTRIDDVGGELNAFTTKENTFLYAAFLKEYTSRAFELLADITFHSTFPQRELEKEKAVVIDEINAYRDDPSEEISDDFDQLVFRNHSLAENILGTPSSVSSFTSHSLHDFHKRTYTTDQMVLCYIGQHTFQEVVQEACHYFERVPSSSRSFVRKKFSGYKPKTLIHEKDNHTCHGMMGNIAYPVKSKYRLAFYMLNHLLGGPSLNSRLNLNIREKFGLTYFLESNYTPFDDTGLWWVYYASDYRNFDRTRQLIRKELNKLCCEGLGVIQLDKLKKQVKGQLALASESPSHLLHVASRSFLLFRQFESMQQTLKKVEKITSSDLMHVANQVFDELQCSELMYVSKP